MFLCFCDWAYQFLTIFSEKISHFNNLQESTLFSKTQRQKQTMKGDMLAASDVTAGESKWLNQAWLEQCMKGSGWRANGGWKPLIHLHELLV